MKTLLQIGCILSGAATMFSVWMMIDIINGWKELISPSLRIPINNYTLIISVIALVSALFWLCFFIYEYEQQTKFEKENENKNKRLNNHSSSRV
jgi:hypothetical protein